MTLDEMIKETAIYCNIELETANGAYAGETILDVEKIKKGLNQAYKKVCREKYHLTMEDRLLPGDMLTKPFFRILKLTTEGGTPLNFEVVGGEVNYNYDGPVLCKYEYVPNALVNLIDEPEIPDEKVSHSLFCYYSAYLYLSIQGDTDMAITWLNMWNEGYESIVTTNVRQSKVIDVYGGFMND